MVSKDFFNRDGQPDESQNLIQLPAGDGEIKNKPEADISCKTRLEQAEARTEQAEARTELAKARTEQAETRTEQAETRTEQAETRTEQAKTRTEEAESRSEQAETRIEEVIFAAEFNYRRLFEAAREGILILEADSGRISDVNPFLIEMLGFPHADFVGKPIWELGTFRDIVSNKDKFEQLQQQGYVRYENLSLETKDGRKITVEFVSNVYQVGDRNVIQCNVRDITERKQVEEALRASEARYRTLFDYAPDGIVIADPESRYIDTNASTCRMLGYTRNELIGLHASDIVVKTEIQHIGPALSAIKAGSNYHREWQFRRKDGSVFAAEVIATAMPDGNLLGMIRDITEHKVAEEKIHQLNAELEVRVIERTAQLQTANEELEAFSYSVSHDLRAPLRHVMGFVDLLQKDAGASLSENSLRHLKTISNSAKRMGTLIDDLLSFSRVGRAELQKADVNLDQLVQEVVGDFQSETKERKIVWQIHPLPVVQADRALIRLALVNLISNAVKFTSHRDEARIEIGCLTEKQKAEIEKTETGVPPLLSTFPISVLPQEETVIFIRDNGAGFDPRYADKLFGVFQRLHSTDEFEGTGIGLANVQRIIQRHGGRVWAEGAEDKGATFFFSIPKHIGGTNGQ